MMFRQDKKRAREITNYVVQGASAANAKEH